MAIDNAELVLAGILPNRRDHLVSARIQLDVDHFTNDTHRIIFHLLSRYYRRTGEVVPLVIFEKALTDQKVDTARVIAAVEMFKTLSAKEVPEDQFKWGVQALKDEQAAKLTGLALVQAMEIQERGAVIDRENLKGDADARRFLTGKLHEIDRLSSIETAPEGDIYREKDEIYQEYLDRKNGVNGKGVYFGIPDIDRLTGGLQPGELCLVCAYANQGKTMGATQMAWDATVKQGLNVFFATTETVREQVRRRVIARHSREEKFGLIDGVRGLNSKDVRLGLLTKQGEKVLKDVLEDLYYTAEYGKLDIAQVPSSGGNLSYVEERLKEFHREYGAQLCVIDYLMLIEPERRRQTRREEYNDLIQRAKRIAISFNDGKGIPVVSPWQIKREAFEQALHERRYSMTALAETAEAERSADLIQAYWRDEDNYEDMRIQHLKVRDGNIPPIVEASIDFRSTWIGSKVSNTSFQPNAAAQITDLDAMISSLG